MSAEPRSAPNSPTKSGNNNITTSNEIDREVKVVVVGESGVGKSSITLRFVSNQFRENMVSTIGASFLSKTVYINTKSKTMAYKFNIWDTAGQEKYRALATLYYRGVDCAVVVYDITDRNSFEQVKSYWVDELLRQTDNAHPVKICISGNKADLEDQRQVSFEEGQELANIYGALFYETSVKSGNNVEDIFKELGNQLAPLPPNSVQKSKNHGLSIPKKRSCAC